MTKRLNVKGPRIKVEVEIPKEQKTASGIIIVDDTTRNKEDIEVGKVVQLGHLAYANFEDSGKWCDVGDIIFFQRYAGKPKEEVGDDGQIHYYRIIKDIDVIATIEE